MPRPHRLVRSSARFLALLAGLALLLPPAAMAQKKPRRDDMTYFQAPETPPTPTDSALMRRASAYVYTLQPGDVLGVAVTSLNAEADLVFNPFARMGTNLTSGVNNTQENNNLPIGYRVSETGTINFPKLGTLPVAGRSLSGLETLFTDSLRHYLREPFVSARLLNFKVSVVGEVNRPSVYTVQNEKITLTEAISLAGDLTIFGRRDNVLVIREANGQREFIRADLTKRSFFSSPAYYLKPGDVIYVEPKSGKKVQASRLLPYVPSILGAATLIATVLINVVRR